MEIYTLLQEFGLDVGIKDFVKEKKEEIKKGFQPLRHDGEKAVFTSEQIADYGPPELYGFTVYVVIELQETAHPLTSDYDFERDRERPRPIHRYSRLERFEFTLAQLLGRRGEIPDMVMSMMVFANKERDKAWNSVRSILKHYKQRLYYNRIPSIFLRMGLGPVFCWDGTETTYQKILADFRTLHNVFEFCQKRKKWGRKYFPSLRFVAVKLLERYGAKCNFNVDFIRTKRKRKALGDIWNDFN